MTGATLLICSIRALKGRDVLLSPVECELAAIALRCFVVIAERLTERTQEESDSALDGAGAAADSVSDAAQRLH